MLMKEKLLNKLSINHAGLRLVLASPETQEAIHHFVQYEITVSTNWLVSFWLTEKKVSHPSYSERTLPNPNPRHYQDLFSWK